MMATLLCAEGRRAQLSCTIDATNHRHTTTAGSAGTIETEFLDHTSPRVGSSPVACLGCQLRVRRDTANNVPFEDTVSGAGSGFRFAAEAFATVLGACDFDAIERAALASLDNAATLEAPARSARLGHAVDVEA